MTEAPTSKNQDIKILRAKLSTGVGGAHVRIALSLSWICSLTISRTIPRLAGKAQCVLWRNMKAVTLAVESLTRCCSLELNFAEV